MSLVLRAAIFVLALTGLARAEQQLVHMSLIEPPSIVNTTNGDRLAYELHVTNFSKNTLHFLELTILAGNDDRILGRMDAEDLTDATLSVAADGSFVALDPGRRAVIYIDLEDADARPGSALSHTLTVKSDDAENAPVAVSGANTEIRHDAPPVLGAPLRGGPWTAVYEPGMERGHRRVFYATEGKAALPGRFAIDFMKTDSEGVRNAGDADRPSDYFGYGQPVLAVADGTVMAVRDDVADPTSRTGRVRPSIGDASGNYVALDIGGGLYAYYEHLKLGAPVKIGDTVKKGDVIGALGFTGSASEPHLHFHIADRLSVLGAEGRPFVFSDFTLLGGYPSIAAFGRGDPWEKVKGGAKENVMPGPNSVVSFADGE